MRGRAGPAARSPGNHGDGAMWGGLLMRGGLRAAGAGGRVQAEGTWLAAGDRRCCGYGRRVQRPCGATRWRRSWCLATGAGAAQVGRWRCEQPAAHTADRQLRANFKVARHGTAMRRRVHVPRFTRLVRWCGLQAMVWFDIGWWRSAPMRRRCSMPMQGHLCRWTRSTVNPPPPNNEHVWG